MNFMQLHQQSSPLLIANVWNVSSTKIAEKLGFQAIGTSSAAIAADLGYEDGEQLSFDELLYIVGRIKANTRLPLSVDLEAGYSLDTTQIIAHTKQLINLGVAGINLEDSVCQPDRTQVKKESFAKILYEIKSAFKKTLFINARTDAFVLEHPNALAETIERVQHYEAAGADGIFIPCIVNLHDIKTICQATTLPVNVMCMPDLPNFAELSAAGVQRISMGNFVHYAVQNHLNETLQQIIQQQSFNILFAS